MLRSSSGAVVKACRTDIALLIGTDDHIVLDILTPDRNIRSFCEPKAVPTAIDSRLTQVTMANQCPICGRENLDNGLCACGYAFSSPGIATPAALGPPTIFLNVAVVEIAIAVSGVAVWAIARMASTFPLALLFLLVMLPWLRLTFC